MYKIAPTKNKLNLFTKREIKTQKYMEFLLMDLNLIQMRRKLENLKLLKKPIF
jgi:hypothetical protein